MRATAPAAAAGIMRKAMRMMFSAFGGSASSTRGFDFLYDGKLPGSNIRWEEKAGELWLNSVVAAALGWISDNFNEAPVRVATTAADGKKQPIEGHPLTKLLRRPNEDSTGSDLMAASLLAWHVDGNSYWLKARKSHGFGKTGELWWIPPWCMRPAWPETGRVHISHYEYLVDGQWKDVDKRDVVHLRNGYDPINTRVGLAPLKSALRQIVGDNEAATYMAAILINTGMPSAIVSPAGETIKLDSDQAKDLKARFRRHFRGDNRGDVLVQTVPLKWEKTAWSPEELALDRIFTHFESRIAALLKVSPMVLGLQSGLDNSTYNNQEQAQRGGYVNCVIPLQARFGEQITWAFDGELIDAQKESVDFDLSGVRALQESADAQYKRLTDAVGGPWLLPDEARGMVGLAKIAGGDALYPAAMAAPPPAT